MRRERLIATQMLLALSVLTAAKGVNNFMGHKETWYNLRMDKVIERADEDLGMTDLYHIREDGVKMYGPWVICAAHPSKVRYTRIDTSLGKGIILDTHRVNDPDLIDIATDW